MDEHALRELISGREGRPPEPPPLRSDHGRPRAHRAAGRPDARRRRGRPGPAQGRRTFVPTKRGGGGPLKTLWWQAPTLLNPHFATGTKDQDAARIFYEPLAGFDPDGNVTPVLAAEVPSVAARARSPRTSRG